MRKVPSNMQQQAASLLLKNQLNETDQLLLQNLLGLILKHEISQRPSITFYENDDDFDYEQFNDDIISRRA